MVWAGRRSDARYCSTRCRVAAHRERGRAVEVVPAPLREADRWVCWDGFKRPIDPATGGLASVTDPSTWGTWEVARRRSERVGFVLGTGIGCVDLDDCLDADGRPNAAATDLLEFYAGSYVEVSPSGRGLHIWGAAPPMRGFRRSWKGQSVEFYSRDRYITVTGNVFQSGELLPL